MIAILVIVTVLLIVSVGLALRLRRPSVQVADAQAPKPLRPGVQEGLFLHPGHTWMEILPSGSVRIGVDEFVGGAVGPVDRILPRPVGERIRQGDPLIYVERGENRLTLPSPLSGTIESSDGLPDTGAGVPIRGSICALRPTRLGWELGCLKVDTGARRWMDSELRRLSAWVGGLADPMVAATQQDGGEPIEGLLEHLEPAAWADFERCFLRSEEGR